MKGRLPPLSDVKLIVLYIFHFSIPHIGDFKYTYCIKKQKSDFSIEVEQRFSFILISSSCTII